MKILVVHNIYKPYYRGGAEVVAVNLVEGIKSKGDEPVVVSLGYQDKVENVDGVKIYRLKPFNIFNYLDIGSKPFFLRCLFHLIDIFGDVGPRKVLRIAKEEKPDFIFLQGIKGFGYVLPRLLEFYGFKTALRVFDMQFIHPSGLAPKNKKSLLVKLYIIFVKALLGNPCLIIFPSQFVAGFYRDLGFFKKSQIKIISNPLPTKIKDLIIEKVDLKDKPSFLFLGQIEKYKGLGDLISALKEVKGDYILYVVGEGRGLNEAKRLALDDKRIVFYGRLDQDRLIREIWPKIDLLINPSLVEETFGMVIIEAYSNGVPVVASEIGALKEIVIENETGWLFRPGDVCHLRYKLQEIVDKKIDLTIMKKNCLKEAEKYSQTNYLSKLYESFLEIQQS
jgi:glycosyltransferase involved in cell wall biosynthesis